MKMQYLVAALMATTSLTGVSQTADAADMRPAPVFKAPEVPRQIVSGYLEMEFGASWMRNTFTDDFGTGTGKDNTWLFNGAGRVNVWWGQNWSTQFDVWGGADTFGRQNVGFGPDIGRGVHANGNIGGHWSWRAPGSYLIGAFGALGGVGSNGSGPNPRGNGFTHGTIGAEWQKYIGMLTLYGQVGVQTSLNHPASNSNGRDDFTAWFIRGVARYFINENLKLEGWGMYATGKGGEDFRPIVQFLNADNFRATHAAWGLGVEQRLQALPFSFFLRYEGSWTRLRGLPDDPGDNGYTFKTTQHAVKGGFRVYLNENTLLFNDRMGTTLDIRDGFTSIMRGIGRTTVNDNIMALP